MESLEGFESVRTRGFYRPSGRVSADLLGDLMTAAIRFARAHDLRDVVVNITAATGFESPDEDYRRRLVKRWAATAAGRLELARCSRCGEISHPPGPVCPRCHHTDPAYTFEPVAQRGVGRRARARPPATPSTRSPPARPPPTGATARRRAGRAGAASGNVT